jgi:hypothetical protein
LAKAKGWIVVYLPNCDEWASMASEEGALRYLLDRFAVALAPHYGQPAAVHFRFGRTWGEILAHGLIDQADTKSVLSDLIAELCEQKQYPLLWIFDEINALFTTKVPWLNGELAKIGPFFANLAASINHLAMSRGWKVLSGTGHERFLGELPSGLTGSVMHLIPLENAEFNKLLESGIL